jgi:hypothetical protein
MSPSPFASSQLARALLLALTKLLDRIVTRRHRRAWVIECVSRQSGSRLPSMVVKDLHDYTWRTSPFMRGKRTLAHLKEHLSWRVQWGSDTCAGCGQTRGEDMPMLTCSCCRVARFCSADHQKRAVVIISEFSLFLLRKHLPRRRRGSAVTLTAYPECLTLRALAS